MDTKHTYQVEALVEVKADDETDARAQVDVILQRAWDTDNRRPQVQPWHFELLDEGLVTDVTEEEKS